MAKTAPAQAMFSEQTGPGPVVAVALHQGHDLRPEIATISALDEATRLREEDPYTGKWAEIAPTRLVALRSRFEVDLNRPRDNAVYKDAEDAWGLQPWTEPPGDDVVAQSLEVWDSFYDRLREILTEKEKKYGRFVVLDLHSYNYRRAGPENPPDDPSTHPTVNVGTGSMDREPWAGLVDRFVEDLRAYPFPGGALDVRENVRFRGGHLAKWVHRNFPKSGCVLAVEVKKFFMDEWTGEADAKHLEDLRLAFLATLPGLTEELSRKPQRSRTGKPTSRPPRPAIRIGLVVNDVASEEAGYTTTRLAMAAMRAGHEVWHIGVADFAYDPDEHVRAHARRCPKRSYKTGAAFLNDLQGKNAVRERITVDDLDVLLLRNDPSNDAISRPWAVGAGIVYGRIAARRGVIVLNDPDGLAKAANKMYFQTFPEQVRPRTLISRNRDDLKAFARDLEGMVVLKPLQGSGGQSVFLVRPEDVANTNQMIDAVSRDGFVVAQEYLPAAERGDTRLFLMNGEPLRYRGRYAAFRRVRKGGDLRSNLHAGGGLARAEITPAALALVEMVRPKLVKDGMFLVGLDIVGDKLMEINVYSPGGLGSAQRFEGVNFADAVVAALERKVGFMGYYQRNFDNIDMATL
jgi:glutathione synthase